MYVKLTFRTLEGNVTIWAVKVGVIDAEHMSGYTYQEINASGEQKGMFYMLAEPDIIEEQSACLTGDGMKVLEVQTICPQSGEPCSDLRASCTEYCWLKN